MNETIKNKSPDIMELLKKNQDLINDLLQDQGKPIIKNTKNITYDNIYLLKKQWDMIEKIIAYDWVIERFKKLYSIKIKHYF